jgi:hypothetical protein
VLFLYLCCLFALLLIAAKITTVQKKKAPVLMGNYAQHPPLPRTIANGDHVTRQRLACKRNFGLSEQLINHIY